MDFGLAIFNRIICHINATPCLRSGKEQAASPAKACRQNSQFAFQASIPLLFDPLTCHFNVVRQTSWTGLIALLAVISEE
jgi:hypothetical protein